MKASSGKMTAASPSLSGNKGAQLWVILCQAFYTIQTVWVGTFKSTVFYIFYWFGHDIRDFFSGKSLLAYESCTLTVVFHFERWIENKNVFMLLLLLIIEKVAQGYFRYGYVRD